jgi:hypothetical protein
MLPQGSESLTLLCRENTQEEILELADNVFRENAQIASIRDGLRIKLESGKLALNYLYFRRRADKFCSQRGSAYFQFKRMEASTQEIKEKVLGEILNCELIVGVVAKPALDFDQRFVDLVFRIAINLDGYVFNGTHLFDATGKKILG